MSVDSMMLVTSPGIIPAQMYAKILDLMGVGGQPVVREQRDDGWHLGIEACGAPAQAWMLYGPDGPIPQDEDEDDEEPEAWIMLGLISYGAGTPWSRSDLHAYLLRETGRWVSERGATWLASDHNAPWSPDVDAALPDGDAERWLAHHPTGLTW